MRSRWLEAVIAVCVLALAVVGVLAVFGEELEDLVQGPQTESSDGVRGDGPGRKAAPSRQDLW